VGALSLREAKAKLRGKLSEEERASRIKALRAELAELEDEAEGRTDEDERRTAEPSYDYAMPARADEDEIAINTWAQRRRREDESEGRTPGVDDVNDLHGRDIGQRRSQPWPGETGNLDPKRRGAEAAVQIFKQAGIAVRRLRG